MASIGCGGLPCLLRNASVSGRAASGRRSDGRTGLGPGRVGHRHGRLPIDADSRRVTATRTALRQPSALHVTDYRWAWLWPSSRRPYGAGGKKGQSHDSSESRARVRPRSVAAFGASEREGTVGGVLMKDIASGGFEGEVWPVNPKHRRVRGYVCYERPDDLPGTPISP